jgi:hypothetical protein
MPVKKSKPRHSTALHRKTKYDETYRSKIVPLWFKLTLPEGAALLEDWLINQDELEKQIFARLDADGISGEQQLFYAAFARRLFVTCLNFYDATYAKEKTSLKTEFILRGLDSGELETIIGICDNKCGLVRGVPISLADEKVKISATDTTTAYLLAKLLAGTGITLTQQNIGGNENILVTAHAQLHKDTHKTLGGDAFVLADLLDCLARIDVKLGGASVGKRRGLNLVQGSNIALTVADDAVNEDVDVTIASSVTPETILMGCMFHDLDGFDIYSTAGTVTKESWGAKVMTTAVVFRAYAFYRYMVLGEAPAEGPAIYDKNPQFELYLRYYESFTNNLVWVIIGATATNEATANQKKFGIIIRDGQLRIVSSDGAVQSETVNLMALTCGTWYRIRCKLTSASLIEVWVDGVSKGTKNTNLPSGTITSGHACPQIVCNSVTDYIQLVYYTGLKVMHDY